MKTLSETDLHTSPLIQFRQWFDEAGRTFGIRYPNAACLSTLDPDGYPDGRIVLLKEVAAHGFVFYTNSLSCKGRSLAAHPRASLTFYWDSMQRQVRAQGDIEPVSSLDADEYFASRPRESQIGAWASMQSEPLESRYILEQRLAEFGEKFQEASIPRPPHWTGYLLKPRRVEFWQERAWRLHDRFLYTLETSNSWVIRRLYP